jgi:hypothetical protein
MDVKVRKMRPCILGMLLMALLTAEAGSCQEAVVTEATVNVRSGPGTTYDIVAKVKEGDRFPVLKVSKLWVQIDIDDEMFEKIHVEKKDTQAGIDKPETWIYRRLIQFIGKPPDFEVRQIDFQNWALDEIPVDYIEFKSDWEILVRLPPDKYASKGKVQQIAQRMAQEYKKQTGYLEKKVVVKILRKDRVYATASD